MHSIQQHIYALIDASEVFLETPSALQVQSLTCSSYKHKNTAKFLVACTPNGGISYVFSMSISSHITRISGFLDKLRDKSGISFIGFTVQYWNTQCHYPWVWLTKQIVGLLTSRQLFVPFSECEQSHEKVEIFPACIHEWPQCRHRKLWRVVSINVSVHICYSLYYLSLLLIMWHYMYLTHVYSGFF